jgi:hypothetical protein
MTWASRRSCGRTVSRFIRDYRRFFGMAASPFGSRVGAVVCGVLPACDLSARTRETQDHADRRRALARHVPLPRTAWTGCPRTTRERVRRRTCERRANTCSRACDWRSAVRLIGPSYRRKSTAAPWRAGGRGGRRRRDGGRAISHRMYRWDIPRELVSVRR